MEKLIEFTGLIAAPFTPMHKDGSLNTDLIPKYYEILERNGAGGAFINGSTGEGASLTMKEKITQVEIWSSCFRKKESVRIINLVGGTCYQECIELAIASKESGVSAIAIVAPYYFKPSDAEILADFCARVGESVPDLPVYFYHIPSLTGVNLPMINLLKNISAKLPNFAGIKFTNEDFMDYQSCLDFENGKYDLLWGRDECMLSALILGAKGFVGCTYNYASPLYHQLIAAFNNNEIEGARILQQKSIDMIALLDKFGGIATGKAYMKYIGLDCGRFRLPVRNMTEKSYSDFIQAVELLDMKYLFSEV